MHLTITGYSTALFSTWYFVEEAGILFDAGDGLISALLQKSRKIDHVFISHADRDHLTGLLQLNQLNAREGYPVICYPRDSRSFPALQQFSVLFDPHVSGAIWKPVSATDEIWLRDDLLVKPVRNGHVPAADHITRSLSYLLIQTRQKVIPELAQLPPEELRRIIMERGKAHTTMEVRDTLLAYSGDTPVEDWQRFDGSEVLIHEATFLGGTEKIKEKPHANKHSTLEEVMEMVSHIRIGKLILGHFSSRYSLEQIDTAIRQCCHKYGISIPVYRIPPGLTVTDILHTSPVNASL
ncbi:MBL fold metallo-hydrolase [Chitinophaga vietnamensis]|uniref:MBL fold metallo-hydrolase n=1 Tax=Chitinophaga vietnamensis TaxID=2593957 RepID=UPI0011777C4E|nr:MBL fold metallo-hydrolase [Chitinophaga vietnamensis]